MEASSNMAESEAAQNAKFEWTELFVKNNLARFRLTIQAVKYVTEKCENLITEIYTFRELPLYLADVRTVTKGMINTVMVFNSEHQNFKLCCEQYKQQYNTKESENGHELILDAMNVQEKIIKETLQQFTFEYLRLLEIEDWMKQLEKEIKTSSTSGEPVNRLELGPFYPVLCRDVINTVEAIQRETQEILGIEMNNEDPDGSRTKKSFEDWLNVHLSFHKLEILDLRYRWETKKLMKTVSKEVYDKCVEDLDKAFAPHSCAHRYIIDITGKTKSDYLRAYMAKRQLVEESRTLARNLPTLVNEELMDTLREIKQKMDQGDILSFEERFTVIKNGEHFFRLFSFP